MDTKTKTPQELAAEAQEARRLTEITVGLGEELLQRAHEISHNIEALVGRTASPPPRAYARSHPQ